MSERTLTQEPPKLLPHTMLHVMQLGLGIKEGSLAKMFAVEDRHEIGRWLTGKVPTDQIDKVESAYRFYKVIQEARPHHNLPKVLTKHSSEFSGRRPMDLILEGNIAEVAAKYSQ